MYISIIFCSNRLHKVKEFFANLETTADNPSDIEINIICDIGEKEIRNFCLNYETLLKINYYDIYYGDLYNQHLVQNEVLKNIKKETYYHMIIADDMRFKTKGWDTILRKYQGYYSDDLFRIRLGWRKHFTYSDVWQCISMPENIDVYTRKWREIVGELKYFSSDSYNELIMYFLSNIDPYNNKICCGERNLSSMEIKMGFHDAEPIEDRLKLKKMVKCWNKSVSYKSQLNAKKIASLLYAEIISNKTGKDILMDEKSKKIKVGDITISYAISRFKVFFSNFYKTIFYLEYAGGGFVKKVNNRKLFSLRWYIYIMTGVKLYK